MSRVGNAPVPVPEGVKVSVNGNLIAAEGPKGKSKCDVHPSLKVRTVENSIFLERGGDSREQKSLHGLYRSLVANMVRGVKEGFEKRLEIRGIGYRAQVAEKKLALALGQSHPIQVDIPEGISVEIVKKPMIEQLAVTELVFTGVDKGELGQFAATIRALRPPEPYKGKGVRNVGEYVRRKAGKKAA